jgi:hypothetical protein
MAEAGRVVVLNGTSSAGDVISSPTAGRSPPPTPTAWCGVGSRDRVQPLVLDGYGDWLPWYTAGTGPSWGGRRLVPAGCLACELDDLIAIANQRLTRPFSDDECRRYLHVERPTA